MEEHLADLARSGSAAAVVHQRVVQALAPLCAELAGRAREAELDDLGGFAPLIDIASQRHDMLYSRLFRS